MAQNAPKETRYRNIGIAVASFALLGWLLMLYFVSASASTQSDLDRQIALHGTAEEIEARIATLTTQADEATITRDANASELDAVSQRLQDAQTEVASLDEEAEALRQERQTLETELVTGREELAQIETGLSEAQDAVATTSQELSDVGERLQDARQQEAELQSGIAALTAEVAELTEEAAEAENRVQTARDAEASLEQSLLAAREEQQEIEATRETLQESVDALSQRREELAADTLAAEQQMKGLQDMTSELTRMLADRSEQLAVLEDRIAGLQDEAGARVRADASSIVLDVPYMHRTTSATFASDGTFEVRNMLNDDSINGHFDLSEDAITLSDVEGDMGDTAFPMTCAVSIDDAGFTLEDADGTCGPLDGASFTLTDR